MVVSAPGLLAAAAGNYRQGDWTIEAQEERKWVRELVRSVLKVETP